MRVLCPPTAVEGERRGSLEYAVVDVFAQQAPMSLAEGTSDPRPQLGAALDQIEGQIDTLARKDLDRPTPCTEYDVRTLLAHLVAVLRKLTAVHEGGDATQVPDPAEDVADDEVGAFRRARTDLEGAWALDTDLGKGYSMAWGTMTGHELLDAYTHEFTVHSWDRA